MSALQRFFSAIRLPSPPKPKGDGIIKDADQSKASGMVTDFAIERFAQALSRIPDPDDVLRRAGMQRHDLKRLEFDDEISGALDTRREAAITTQWKLESEAESEAKTFVEKELKAVFDQMMRGCWDAVPYGYSVTEAIYTMRDASRIGIERMAVKPMQWFEPLRDGRLVMGRPGEGRRVDLDIKRKFLLVRRNPTYAQPYGEALLSRLYWAWFFRHNGWRAWMQFIDRFGDPFVVGKSGDPKAMVEALLGMGVKNVLGVGTDDSLEVIMQNGDGVFDRLDQRLTERIVKLILGQTLTSGTGKDGGGSYALGKVHDQVRQDKRLADVRLLTNAGQWLVESLWDLNTFDGKPPKFIFQDPADINIERASRDAELKDAGIVGGYSEDYLINAYGFEKGDFTMPDPNAVVGPAKQPRQPKPKPGKKPLKATVGDDHTPRAKGRKDFTPAQQAIEDLGDDAMLDAPESPLDIEDIRAAIVGAKDRDDLERRLAALIDKQDAKFAEVLAQASFAADVLGYIHATEGA